MELFTLNRKFLRQDTIDKFHSTIWTERYYGDGEVELIVPASLDLIQKLKEGTFIGLVGSDEIMIIDTQEIEEGKLTIKGNSLLKWLDNRFIRVTAAHPDRYWNINGTPGWIMWAIIYYMCIEGSPYLNGTVATGIPNPQALAIPGLWLGANDNTGAVVNIAVPYGPVYDALKNIGTTYQIGQKITLASATDASYSLLYWSYRGLNRTSAQTANPVVRFSPNMDSLTDIKEFRSVSNFKTHAYSFAPSNPGELATTPGKDDYGSSEYNGFDLRAMMIFCEDITTDTIGGDANVLLNILNTRAHEALMDHKRTNVVDGELVPNVQFKYGADYNLGDVIELQGNSGVVNHARVTEYIRTQDGTGERAYPTVSIIE